MKEKPDYPAPTCARVPRGKKPIEPHEPHNHRCSQCGLIWHHDPAQLMPGPMSSQVEHERARVAFRRSHECPTCGAEMHYIDQTGTPAQCVFDGTGEPIPITEQPVYHDDLLTQLKRSLLAESYE